MKTATETEVKIRLSDRAGMLGKLARAGLSVSSAREFESNTLYDTEDQKLRSQGVLLRLRQSGGKCVITWKGPGDPGRHKNRRELETTLGALEPMRQILEQLGYHAAFRYEKYRTELATPGEPGVVTVDETPIGDFLELEGPGDWIDDTARKLGFKQDDYIIESYGRLYLAECERRGVQPSHMVFPSEK